VGSAPVTSESRKSGRASGIGRASEPRISNFRSSIRLVVRERVLIRGHGAPSRAWWSWPKISIVPPAQEHSYHNQCKALKDRLRPAIGKLEARLRTVEGTLQLSWDSRFDVDHERAVQHCRGHAPGCVIESSKGLRIDDEAWLAYLAELKDERVRLVDELKPLRDEYARELVKVEELLGHWL